MKISENFQKFVEIFLFFCFVFLINFRYYYQTFRTLKNINSMLKFVFVFRIFLNFLGDLQDLLLIFRKTQSSKFPEDPKKWILSSSISEECYIALSRFLEE